MLTLNIVNWFINEKKTQNNQQLKESFNQERNHKYSFVIETHRATSQNNGYSYEFNMI